MSIYVHNDIKPKVDSMLAELRHLTAIINDESSSIKKPINNKSIDAALKRIRIYTQLGRYVEQGLIAFL